MLADQADLDPDLPKLGTGQIRLIRTADQADLDADQADLEADQADLGPRSA